MSFAYKTAPHSAVNPGQRTSSFIMSDDTKPEYTNPTGIASAAYQVFIQLPYSALTTPRQAGLSAQGNDDKEMPGRTKRYGKERNQLGGPVSEELFELVTSPESVSSLLAQEPTLSPGRAWKNLYGNYDGKPSSSPSIHQAGETLTPEDALERAAECGNWGPTQPSELFLRVSLVDSKHTYGYSTDINRCTTMLSAHWRTTQPALWLAHPSWGAAV